MHGGVARVDPHVKVLDERVVSRARARGLDALVYAPHFVRLPEIVRRAEQFSRDDLAIIPGREVFAGTWRNRTHVLAIGLTEPVPDFISLEAAMAEFDRQGAVVLVPHPEFGTFSLAAATIRQYRDRIHAVETYNPKHFARHNRRAQEIQESLSIPAFASSYAHLTGTVGEVWTTIECEPTAAGVIDALRTGVPREIEHRQGLVHRLRTAGEFCHLFYENGPSKAYLLWTGPKATNPYDPAYAERFHEAAVYPQSLSTRPGLPGWPTG